MSRKKPHKPGQRGQQLSGAMKRDIATITWMYLSTEPPKLARAKVEAWVRKAYRAHYWAKAFCYAHAVLGPNGKTLIESPLRYQEAVWVLEVTDHIFRQHRDFSTAQAVLWLALYKKFKGAVPMHAYRIASVAPPPQQQP